MKVIFCMSDSFRYDHLGFVGDKGIHTPSLNKFSKEASLFTNTMAGSLLTVANRLDLLLGRPIFTHTDDERLEKNDVTIGMVLEKYGIKSQMVTDTANTMSHGRNNDRGFSFWYHNRGQEGDPYMMMSDVPLKLTCPLEMVRYPKDRWHQVVMNRSHRKVETDWFAPGTYQWAINWLERNYRQENFLLWIDGFDPHEPYDPPQHYIDLYDPGYEGRIFDAPTYGLRKKMDFNDRELKHTRALYAGECSMVDRWFGKLVETVEKLGIKEETMIIFTCDHGHYLDYPGDGGLIGKPRFYGKKDGSWRTAQRPEDKVWVPLYNNLIHQLLLMYVPGKKARTIADYVQPHDIMPTILDYFKIKKPDNCYGESLLPVISGKKKLKRKGAATGINGELGVYTSGKWQYNCWVGHRPCALFDMKQDPHQKNNVAKKYPEVVKKLHKEFIATLRTHHKDNADYVAQHDPMM